MASPMRSLCAAAALGCLPAIACAQADGGGRPVRVVSPFTPGSAGDIIPRAIGPAAAEALRQPVVVDNRPGAAGAIAADLVAKGNADGHTLLFGTTGTLVINPVLYEKLPYDPLRDFVPVVLCATSQYAVIVAPTVPVSNVREYIGWARARPEGLNLASSGAGTSVHLSGELFNLLTGIRTVHVPYKGAAEAITDLIAGRVHVMFASLSSALPYIRAGRVRALAVTSGQRHASVPDLPTVREAGVPEYESTGFFGYLAPAATPRAAVERLNGTLSGVLKTPAMKEKLAALGVDVAWGAPDQFRETMRTELAKWARVVKAAGLKPI